MGQTLSTGHPSYNHALINTYTPAGHLLPLRLPIPGTILIAHRYEMYSRWMNGSVYTGTPSVCLGSICGTAIITVQTQVTIQVLGSLFLPDSGTPSGATNEIKHVLERYLKALSDGKLH